MRRSLLPLAWAALTVPTLIHAQSGSTPPAHHQVPAPRPAPASQPRTLPEAIGHALAAHPQLSAATREVEASDAARLQAAAWPNPELGIEVEDTRSRTRTTTLQLSQPIELGGQRSARVAAAQRTREIAQWQLAARRAEVRAAVITAFAEALIAQEHVRLSEESLQLAGRAAQTAAQRVVAGKISPIEATKAQVAVSTVRLDLLRAQGELRSALKSLAAAVGDGQPVERVEGDIELPPPSAPTARPLAERLNRLPAYRAALLEVERRRALADLERARRVPDLTVIVGAKRSEELGRNQAVVGLSIPLPVFDTHRGAHLEALRRQDQAGDDARALALRLEAELQRSEERLRTTRAEAQTLQHEVLPGAQAAYEAATQGFQLGKFGFLDVLDAQRTLLDARARYLRALGDAHRAASDIERLTGGAEELPAATVRP